jgi:hypothetical protein
MPIPTLTPPATPVVIYSTETAAGLWTCTRSNGTVLATNTATPVKDCSVALRAASVDLSTLVTLLGPSGNPTYGPAQLSDMPTS